MSNEMKPPNKSHRLEKEEGGWVIITPSMGRSRLLVTKLDALSYLQGLANDVEIAPTRFNELALEAIKEMPLYEPDESILARLKTDEQDRLRGIVLSNEERMATHLTQMRNLAEDTANQLRKRKAALAVLEQLTSTNLE